MKLYEINEYFECVLKDVAEEMAENGCISEETAKRLGKINIEFTEKANAIACVIKNKRAFAAANKDEGNMRLALAKREAKGADNLESYLFNEMKKAGRDEIKTSQNLMKIKKNPPSVEVTEEFIKWAQHEIGCEDLLTYHDPTPSKSRIKEAIEKGQNLPYVKITQTERLDVK